MSKVVKIDDFFVPDLHLHRLVRPLKIVYLTLVGNCLGDSNFLDQRQPLGLS